MPELPEVETIRRALQVNLPGKVIETIAVREPRLRWPVDENKLRQLALGQTVAGISRRAKYLLIRLRAESTLLIHLGMSGRVLYLTEKRPFDKHDHVIFNFADKTELRFRDPRRFGLVDAAAPGELEKHPRLVHLGVEPLEHAIIPAAFYDKVKQANRPVKNLLMDAGLVAGVGNIYANEALYYAGIHPAASGNQIDEADWQRIWQAINQVLRAAIAKGGTTLTDFADSNGEAGYFQLSLVAYGRAGQPCLKCGTAIQRIVQVGRSTYFCPTCQPSD